MFRPNRVFVLVAALIGIVAPKANGDSILTIGNSLTWDSLPPYLSGDVDWHIYCGKSLSFINENPEGHCVTSSTPWPVALASKDYDFVTVQPYLGSTFDEDLEIISNWMRKQPNATFVVHTGWNTHETHFEAYVDETETTETRISRDYFDRLMDALHEAFPDRKLVRTQSAEVLYEIALDIENGNAPIDKLSDLYRDTHHMSTSGGGHYLMHNLLRKALGQPAKLGTTILPSDTQLSPELTTYLNSKFLSVSAVPEPNMFVGFIAAAGAGCGFFRRRFAAKTSTASR
ncbi:hypothetical protein [Crateriforma conspicua]|uniref:PEP-CTERM protein-sorting domain-containing protein n=1 Tax=Crateriforma conspicua TaxID=2527996 RepID=A0A5C5XRS8_9PLAN|nr:hypothetical protein [Crateriforma conspicua]QDV66267.1 hypothetical protein Mal65_54430 [Crateriforma conspicua]TWT65604.1 hypothetical protein Pan14r_51510 [Crateriforma conspicua]